MPPHAVQTIVLSEVHTIIPQRLHVWAITVIEMVYFLQAHHISLHLSKALLNLWPSVLPLQRRCTRLQRHKARDRQHP
jgi:hypothetical protein